MPIYQSQEFVPPKSLNKKELEVWGFIVNVFRQTRNCQASDADIYLMQMYCRDKVMLDEAAERWRKNPVFLYLYSGREPKGSRKYFSILGKRSKRASIANLRLANCPKRSLRRRVPADAP